MVGMDKFFAFLEPACSMMEYISPIVWKGIGVLQIAAGILIWSPKYRKYVVGFFSVFMIAFTFVHISQGTKDYGGAAFIAVLLGLLVLNPSFIRSKTND